MLKRTCLLCLVVLALAALAVLMIPGHGPGTYGACLFVLMTAVVLATLLYFGERCDCKANMPCQGLPNCHEKRVFKCTYCGTQYFAPGECDWCPGLARVPA